MRTPAINLVILHSEGRQISVQKYFQPDVIQNLWSNIDKFFICL